ncbi:MAG TPA: M28 family peptidase [Longimicrobiales bacterium]|nr:M28 family peptidase [Longimicrobiales bacterium]
MHRFGNLLLALTLASNVAGCAAGGAVPIPPMVPPGGIPHAADPGEPRLTNLRRLTDGGQNAEAYFSPDGQRLIFQSTMPGVSACDQQFTMTVGGQDLRMVSTGQGRTTCGYFQAGGERIVYSSTHHVAEACPAEPDYSQGYVWALYDYDIYSADDDGGALARIFTSPAYDAEATLSPDGRTIVFTSARDGDLDIYTMRTDGSAVRKLTDAPGYDGGPFFSPDGSRIVYRAHHPADPRELEEYRRLLAQGLIRPTRLDLWVMDADGGNKVRVTDNGAANFAPYFHPSGERIIFSSNMHDPRGRDFDLYLIGADGSGLERVTVHPDFDGFPQFSPVDPRLLVFASNQGGNVEGETNVYLADWIERPAPVALRAPVRPGTGMASTAACPAIDAAAAADLADYTGRYLADDALEGRDAGSAGAACAAEYLAWTFRRIGLAPGGPDGTYFQDVPLASVTNPHAGGGSGRNVLAVLPGTDRRADEYIVVGAHFDHLGRGGMGSLDPGSREIHNGADDNASGVAALVRVAERLAVGPRPRRPVLFMAFTGEEDGLLGSSHWTKDPTVPLEKVVAMINLDMVGRLRENGLVVYGVGTAREWTGIVDPLVEAAGIATVSRIPDGYGASDQTAFYMHDIPVLHLFTNTHADYHRPSDDWERIDVAGIETVAEIVADITRRVGSAPRMAVIRNVGRAPAAASAEAGPGYGAYLGTIPDFSPVEYGVLLGGVREGGPADRAGLRKGDIIVRVGDVEVKDLYALTDALRKYRPGDEVPIAYLRDGTPRSTRATLAARN